MDKYVEVDGQKFVDDGTGNPKLGEDNQPIPFIEEKTVPYGRFKEINDKLRDSEREISVLKAQGKKEGGLTPEQEKELQAKTYLTTLLRETLEEDKKSQTEKEGEEQKQFEQQVKDILVENTDVKQKDFLDFIIKVSEEFGVETPMEAMKLYRHLEQTKKEAKEEEWKKPGMPLHEGGAERIEVKPEDKGKSLSQITNEIQGELRKK